MKTFAGMRARPKTLASAGVVTVSAVAITTLAFVYQGLPTTEVDLHDGGVWLTKQSSLLVGHFNHESAVLDGGLRTASDSYDVLQSGSTVVVVDDTHFTVAPVDPAMVTLGNSADIPAGAKVALGGKTLAVLDPASGDLWIAPADSAGSFTTEGKEPVASLGKGADVAVGTDGTVHAVSPSAAQLVSVTLGPDGSPGQPSSQGVEGLHDGDQPTITTVGATAVVLDGTTLYGSNGLRASAPEGAVLQQPSPDAPAVALADATDLVTVPLDGSAPTEHAAGARGTAAAPVTLKGCTYAAWSGSGKFVRDCAGDADDLATDIQGLAPTAKLKFRQNRDVVVLNDVIGGTAWMASESMQRVDNWSDITPPEGNTEDQDKTTQESTESAPPVRNEINTPPVAVDDEYGVRPGRTTVLPVLDNDNDADGDVLTASVVGSGSKLGPIQQINNGGALQIAVPESATGSDSFRYQADDGRGGTAQATVRLAVHDWSVNAAPVQKRVTSITVESGSTASYNVLPDWTDPDGDEIYLKSVTPAAGDEADFTPNGQITYRAISGTQGRKDVAITVSDGKEDATGTVRFDVRPVGSTSPVTNADHVVTRVGQSVTVSPLDNDTSAGQEVLRLARVDEVAGATIVPDYSGKTFTFTSPQPGTYYVQYLAAAGAANAAGIVRVDVLPAGTSDLPPIAVRDIALLPSGGDVLVNVLGNDYDPAGGILVVQSVDVPPNLGVSVSVLGHETLRVTDQAALSQQVRFTYRISNGSQTADGEVVVIPIPAPSRLQPPVANDDQVVVRAGDVVNIPVLDNDYDPNGDTLHVAPDLVPPLITPDQGEMFVSQDTVRFKASDKPGTVHATYEAVDSSGQKDAAYITIQVLPVNADTNSAPRPRDLVARTVSGAQVQIGVPLDGIDPDGDSVDLVGIDSAPTKGRIVETGDAAFTYEAFSGSTGVDSFTYRVRDRLGKEATAAIRVGIAPAESVNHAPYAVKDTVVMRPNRQVAVPVLQNDSDPDGDQISLVPDGLVLPDLAGLSAEVQGNRVVVTSPGSPVETSVQYTIKDARGATATAVVQITVADDVPLSRPIARDDRVRAEDVKDNAADVDVLANDEDPDGTVSALKISVPGGDGTVTPDNKVRVTLGDTAQLVMYTVTDVDGQAASAFIRVPALSDLPPTLTTVEPVQVKSGETIELPLSQYVRAAGGGAVILTEAAKVSAVHANGNSLIKDERTLVYTSAQGYFGQDALTFEVTDGTGPDDPAGRKATLTLPITVIPPDNQPPTFANGEVNVAPGEPATALDLRGLTTDPDPGDLDKMSYSIVGNPPAGMSASIDGQQLKVSADSGTAKGTAGTVTLSITDGTTQPIQGTVAVTVTASTRPLPTANDDIVAEAPQGKTATVNVLQNDFNPFPDTPLTVTTATIETGKGEVSNDGTTVNVTPDGAFFGTMVVRYRIQDATRDPDREVEGRIRLTVQGRPDAPGTPTVSSVQDRTVVLSWRPPADNGASITGYTVRSTAGNYTKQCAAATCTLDGLTNDVEYNFTVTAINKVGESDPSAPSQTARPDARPDTPDAPTLQFGDRKLVVNWTTPSTPGSPVQSYNLEISPAPSSGSQKTGITGNTYTWEGLQNGTAYQVRVQAVNRAPEPSSWSQYSANMVPATVPDAPAAPTTQRLDPVGSQAQMKVSWNPPGNNGGDAVSSYRLNVIRGGSVIKTLTVPGSQTSQTLNIDASTSDYTFTVAAANKAGWGADSSPSAPRRAFVAPGQPTNVQASTPNPDNSIVVTYNAAPGNGAQANEVSYEYNVGGGWRGDWDGRRITNGISNGTSYSVQVRAYTSMDGVRYTGDPSAGSNAAVPYGPVNTPGADARNNGQNVTLSWSMPGTNGRPIDRLEIRIDGGGWENVGANGGSRTVGDWSQTHSIDVRAYDSTGQVSQTNSASARSNDPPQPSVRVSRGSSAVGQPGCASSSCAYFLLNIQNFSGGTHQIACNATGPFGGTPFSGPSRYDNVPGNGTYQLRCYFGGPGDQVWVTIDGTDYERSTW